MDKEQARFLLHSFRPDGADVSDQDFTEALAMAMADRELGEWLAEQRAVDAVFARALTTVPLPETLRQAIVACLGQPSAAFPQAEDANDTTVSEALAARVAPPALRNQILAAMERSAVVGRVHPPIWRRMALPLAAAAAIVLALGLIRSKNEAATMTSASLPPVEVVQAAFLRAYESPQFSSDAPREDPARLIASLQSRQLPCPCCLPQGLSDVSGIVCHELVVEGKRGALVCFETRANGTIHLVIFRRAEVGGILPARDHPAFVQDGRWAAARWEHDQNVFILLGDTEVGKLAALF